MSSTDDTSSNDYASRPEQRGEPVPVQNDEADVGAAGVSDPDSEAQLAKDDTEAIDESNIVEGRTRGAAPKDGYREPGDEEGLPTDDGTSSGAAQ